MSIDHLISISEGGEQGGCCAIWTPAPFCHDVLHPPSPLPPSLFFPYLLPCEGARAADEEKQRGGKGGRGARCLPQSCGPSIILSDQYWILNTEYRGAGATGPIGDQGLVSIDY